MQCFPVFYCFSVLRFMTEIHFAMQTEVLKQLSSMGRLVVGAGNGAVQRAANL